MFRSAVLKTIHNISFSGIIVGKIDSCYLINISKYNDILILIPHEEVKSIIGSNLNEIKEQLCLKYNQSTFNRLNIRNNTYIVLKNVRKVQIAGKLLGELVINDDYYLVIKPSEKSNINYFVKVSSIDFVIDESNTKYDNVFLPVEVD